MLHIDSLILFTYDNFLSFIFPTAKQAEVRTDFYDTIPQLSFLQRSVWTFPQPTISCFQTAPFPSFFIFMARTDRTNSAFSMKLLEARQAQIWFEYQDNCKRGSSMYSVELSLAHIPVTACPFIPVTWLNWTIRRDIFAVCKQNRPHHVPVVLVTSLTL